MTTTSEGGWASLLQFVGHEVRNSFTVINGYVRMLLTERAGALTVMQRHFLEEVEKSCARLSVLLAEVSDVASIESGRTAFKSSAVDLRRVLTDAIAALPVDTEHPVEIVLATTDARTRMMGDEPRLKAAFVALFWALRRELADGNQLEVRYRDADFRGKPAQWIVVGEPRRIAELESATAETLTAFNEYRGGCGLSLAVARRVIDRHGGALWSPGQGTRAGAVVALPRS
jgi:two-component system, NarL family, capsular synthesis sensor histidine kinase RcsC